MQFAISSNYKKIHFLNIFVEVHCRNHVHGTYLGLKWVRISTCALDAQTTCGVTHVVSNLDRFTLHNQFLSEGSSRAADSDSATKQSLGFYCTRRLKIVFTHAPPSGLYSEPKQVT